MHMHSQRIDVYPGDYEHFVKAREDRLKSQQREYESQKQYRDHIQVGLHMYLCHLTLLYMLSRISKSLTRDK